MVKKTAKKAAKKKAAKPAAKEQSSECHDKLCPFHGKDKLRMRGRTFEGTVIRKFHGRITIEFLRMIKVPKYERYEKRKTKIHARLPDCLSEVEVGDRVQVSETRPISKTIHTVVSKIVRSVNA